MVTKDRMWMCDFFVGATTRLATLASLLALVLIINFLWRETMVQSRRVVAPWAFSIKILGFGFAVFCLLFAAASRSEEGRYIITYVYDGDTVKLRPVDANNSQQDFKLRLTDIDAPERNQNYGPKSRRALIKLCQGKNIRVTTQIVARDKYHRALGRLHCNHTDASLYLAEKGLAWEVKKYSSDVNIYHATVNARKKKLGLWADSNPIPPWDWRKNYSP